MFVLNALASDKRFRDGLIYVEDTIKAFQTDSRVSGDTPFPLDLEITEIAVTIDAHSEDYVVGDKITTPRVINSYDSKLQMLEAEDIPSIRVLKVRDDTRNNNYKKGGYKKRDNKVRNTQMCKACLGIGHCITNPDTICYNVAKQQIYTKFLDTAENTQALKSNFY